MSGQMVSISGADGAFEGYLSTPAGGTGPGIVIIQEIFGVNPFLKTLADAYAAEGYIALVPDLFWRLEPGLSLNPSVEAEWNKALELYQKFDVDAGVKDISAAIAHLRGIDGATGKVGAVGYCLGGLLAYLTAARTDSDGTVGYYGVGIENHLKDADKISAPLLLHYAEEDGFVPKDAQEKVKTTLADARDVTVYSYPGRDHAFARSDDPAHYHPEDAALADGRTKAFFKEHLG
ncbi:MAG: dienelactone hydrolase family protein [Pseudomonadota bacterium]